jgi:hypothetical protein
MSCGNRFQCGLRKPTRFSFQPDKPSNPELYNENQKRLNDLLKAREEQNNIYSFNNNSQMNNTQNTNTIFIQNNTENLLISNSSDSQFTPWRTPSSTYFPGK